MISDHNTLVEDMKDMLNSSGSTIVQPLFDLLTMAVGSRVCPIHSTNYKRS